MQIPIRHFKLKVNRSGGHVTWLNRHTVYEGKLLSMTARTVSSSVKGEGAIFSGRANRS